MPISGSFIKRLRVEKVVGGVRFRCNGDHEGAMRDRRWCVDVTGGGATLGQANV
ncbi:hypothetical protein BofuT4_uP050090.1 [Botrytis cinerea T4]|uniref:Uncharacterized protein n=1 Tax=Botryotinia fuckeliana (strain T4) TaxID=999810 RepID=G2XZV4_BOTF4|nr:hypothetical protein BofuT4_uP050090.1 [Botrytis cinerea T4]